MAKKAKKAPATGGTVTSIADGRAAKASKAPPPPPAKWACTNCGHTNKTNPDALIEKCAKCAEPSPRQKEAIKVGLQHLGGGINTAANVEEAARLQEGIGPKKATKPADPQLPFPKGRFDALKSWDALITQRHIVSEAERVAKDLHDQYKEARSRADREQDTLNKMIDVADEKRRTDAKQPYLQDQAEAPPARKPCAWEQAHPGQTCPICAAPANGAVAKTDGKHPESKDHLQAVEVQLHESLGPVVEQLQQRSVFTDTLTLARLTDDERAQVSVFASGQGAIPPPALVKAHVAASPGDEHQSVQQACTRCGAQIWNRKSGAKAFPKDALVLIGAACEPEPARRTPARSSTTQVTH